MGKASWVLHPADDKVLASTGQQHDLALAALHDVDTAARVQRDRFLQDQCSSGSGLLPPRAELEQPGRGPDQREDADQRADDQQQGLWGHSGWRPSGVAVSAFVRMRLFGGAKVKKPLTGGVNLSFTFFRQIEGMDPTHIGLFDLAARRLAWTAQRQSVLASNIANANTPAFQARDIQSFDRVLSGLGAAEPLRTQPNHMTGTAPAGLSSLTIDPPKVRALDGNTVALDQQLTRVADTETTQALVTTIWKKYMGMFSMALGRSG